MQHVMLVMVQNVYIQVILHFWTTQHVIYLDQCFMLNIYIQ